MIRNLHSWITKLRSIYRREDQQDTSPTAQESDPEPAPALTQETEPDTATAQESDPEPAPTLTQETEPDTAPIARIWIAPMVAVSAIVAASTAWISDDAAITLRTVLNFVNGYGPVFNVGERVQAYTHPLWFLLLSIATKITGDVFYATFALSIATSALAFALLLRWFATTALKAGVLTVAAVGSKAFVDYQNFRT